MEIRDATEADLPAIVDIYNAAIPGRLATADTEPISVESRRRWFREHTPSHRPLWVAERDGAIMGWLSFGDFYGRHAYRATAEISIYIATAGQRTGLGRLLLQRAIDESPRLGVTTLLGFIFGHNAHSLALFARFGFAEWGRLPRVAVLDGVERDLIIVGRRVASERRKGHSPPKRQSSPMTTPLPYPPARRSDQADDYHGTRVADPYRWLENSDSPETAAWIEAENRGTEDYLGAIPGRDALRDRLTRLWDYERYGILSQKGGRYFFAKNDGLQNQSVWYVTEALDAPPRILLDPNGLSGDGTIALSGLSVSRDGRLLAYGLSSGGSDWQEWRVRDVDTGRDLPDRVEWVKFSGASWAHDGSGFYYSRYDAPPPGEALQQANRCQKLFFHTLGTPQAEDALIHERPDEPEWGFRGGVTEDGDYLLVHVWVGTDSRSRIFYQDLTTPDAPVVPLLDRFDAQYSFVGNDGPVFWFRTDNDAPRGRVIAVDTRQPHPEHWQEVIPEAADTLEGVGVVGERFLAAYLQDAQTRVKVFKLDGVYERDVDLPGIGSAGGFGGLRTDTETFYSFTSYTTPATVYRYDIGASRSTLYREPQVDFDPDGYETRQVFYNSKDGTRVPMFLVHRKGLAQNGANPTLLYGYGGFDVSLTPAFSVANLVWLERGGVLAVPNLRGGGEYGKTWHEAGMKANKQNVFDDFIAAAEWLIAQGYTSCARLAIHGGSNGGLLVGACLTQRPELFGAALPSVGVLDMLRFQRFTIGWAWTTEYGTADDPSDFPTLLAYSPLHNLRPGTRYPATLITTGDHDDRVVPAHSFKFAAALQAAQGGDAPVLIRIETRAGHGAGKPTTKVIAEAADRWAFLLGVFGLA